MANRRLSLGERRFGFDRMIVREKGYDGRCVDFSSVMLGHKTKGKEGLGFLCVVLPFSPLFFGIFIADDFDELFRHVFSLSFPLFSFCRQGFGWGKKVDFLCRSFFLCFISLQASFFVLWFWF